MNLQLGSRVKLSPRSEFYSDKAHAGSSNPINCLGTVFQIENELLGVYVQWDNGKKNSYDDEDLIMLNSDPNAQESDTTKAP
jgi:hypothetical protein